jgi:hypothetical protein
MKVERASYDIITPPAVRAIFAERSAGSHRDEKVALPTSIQSLQASIALMKFSFRTLKQRQSRRPQCRTAWAKSSSLGAFFYMSSSPK